MSKKIRYSKIFSPERSNLEINDVEIVANCVYGWFLMLLFVKKRTIWKWNAINLQYRDT